MSEPTIIGRIVDHAPDWKWVRLEPGHGEVKRGDALRVRFHAEVEWRRGIVPVLHQEGDRIYADCVMWWDAIPAIADMDYVYLWSSP